MSARRTAIGNDGLSIGRGGVIQTRRNDSGVRVANRQVWVAQSVEEENSVWVTERAAGHRPRSARLPANYVAEHTHLAYVATAHGVQSMTVDESHTVVGGATGAASVYVGMTRGRDFNRVHLVAANADEAREQFVLATERDRADRGPYARDGRRAGVCAKAHDRREYATPHDLPDGLDRLHSKRRVDIGTGSRAKAMKSPAHQRVP